LHQKGNDCETWTGGYRRVVISFGFISSCDG
jgi:hypothetical protein